MSGWFAVPSSAWDEIAAALPKPWPRGAAVADLRHAENAERCGARFPGRVHFQNRWGWSEHAVRSLLRDEATWRDPAFSTPNSPSRLPAVSQPSPNRLPAHDGATPQTDGFSPSRLPAVSQPSPIELHTRVDKQENQEQENQKDTPLPPSGGVLLVNPEPSAIAAPTKRSRRSVEKASDFAWAAPVARQTNREVSEVVSDLARCVEAVSGQSRTPSKTFAAPVLALWRATGTPWLEFIGDFLLVAEAAKSCPDRVFARDIRAEGWPDGTDRSGDVATLAVHRRWDVRLETARRWKRGGAGGGWLTAVAPEDVSALGLCDTRDEVDSVLRSALSSGRMDRATAVGVRAAWWHHVAGRTDEAREAFMAASQRVIDGVTP